MKFSFVNEVVTSIAPPQALVKVTRQKSSYLFPEVESFFLTKNPSLKAYIINFFQNTTIFNLHKHKCIKAAQPKP